MSRGRRMPLCTQLTPSSAERARRERRHPKASKSGRGFRPRWNTARGARHSGKTEPEDLNDNFTLYPSKRAASGVGLFSGRGLTEAHAYTSAVLGDKRYAGSFYCSAQLFDCQYRTRRHRQPALVKLPQLTDRTTGSSDVKVALIDGPVAIRESWSAGTASSHPCSMSAKDGSRRLCQSYDQVIDVSLATRRPARRLGCDGGPFGQRGGAFLSVNLAGDEMAH
jgi:hypothetical protein